MYTDRDGDILDLSVTLGASPNSVIYSILPLSSGDEERDDDDETLSLLGGLDTEEKSRIIKDRFQSLIHGQNKRLFFKRM